MITNITKITSRRYYTILAHIFHVIRVNEKSIDKIMEKSKETDEGA